jgi:hypothetical protein
MKRFVFHTFKDNCYYKINDKLKRITKIEENEVSYLDYDNFAKEVKRYKNLSANRWKQIENKFFLSRDFEWEYNGEKYKTNDKRISWEKGEYGGLISLVFHNGKIWEASNNGNYYPRIQLSRELYAPPTRTVLVEKEKNILRFNSKTRGKWTDIKYCRNFEKIS